MAFWETLFKSKLNQQIAFAIFVAVAREGYHHSSIVTIIIKHILRNFALRSVHQVFIF